MDLIKAEKKVALERTQIPNLKDASLFAIKAGIFSLRRGFINLINPVKRYSKCPARSFVPSDRGVIVQISQIAHSDTPLWTSDLETERELLAGKIHNLRIAIKNIDGIELQEGQIFSFWQQIGKPTQSKGYVKGREIRQGCIIPAIAGGLCQLSNALYSVALDAGFEIIERHAHTQIIAGSLAEIGRDATVFWNYVDLRFRANQTVRIEVELTSSSLIIRLKGRVDPVIAPEIITDNRETISDRHSCTSCEVSSCFRNIPVNSEKNSQNSHFGKTAYLVDAHWLEYDRYIQAHRLDRDILAIPLDGSRFKKENYKWNRNGFVTVKTATITTLMRAWESRNIPAQGSSLQNTLLKHDRKLVQKFITLLKYDVTHVVVMQNLLPFLWEEGVLQGRTFDVLMTRLPIDILQTRLDRAYRLHPQSPTLSDFRVSDKLGEIERLALDRAQKIISPHSEILHLFADRAIALDWEMPQSVNFTEGSKILFPASTLGRKGAYEVREVAKKLNLELLLLGNEKLEGDNFWQDVFTQKADRNLDGVGLVILPAFVEHNPRILLQAIARGIPVIASSACGLDNLKGVDIIPAGDVESLEAACRQVLNQIL